MSRRHSHLRTNATCLLEIHFWRLSNAISWVAGQTDDPERKLDLQKIAGSVLPEAV
jgi:hypothetical protein